MERDVFSNAESDCEFHKVSKQLVADVADGVANLFSKLLAAAASLYDPASHGWAADRHTHSNSSAKLRSVKCTVVLLIHSRVHRRRADAAIFAFTVDHDRHG